MSEKKRPELEIQTGELAGRRFAVGDGGLRLGRSSSNDIRVPDEELSRNHCLFETSGEDGIRIIDLASANGTFVNGVQVGGSPVDLHPGDVLKLGSTRILVIGEGMYQAAAPKDPATAEIDLGLGSAAGGAQSGGAPAVVPATAKAARRRGPFGYFLWAFAAVVIGLALWLLQLEPPSAPSGATEGESVRSLSDDGRIVEMSYEKVSADSKRIFRYKMDLSSDGTLKVSVDDVPDANRHIVKSSQLSTEALGRIREIFADPELQSLDREYAGPVEEPPKLESCYVKVVFSHRVRVVRVVNTPEPDAFRRMRERLETFTKNELGIWAIQYSAERLVELAEASARTAQTKWEDRDVVYGNIHAAIAAWREALFYLETVNPKPAAYEEYRTAREKAVAELDRRYAEQRFRADKAIHLADWATAAAELKILCEMVPDREDERTREATAKLLDAERRQKKGGEK